MPLVLHLRHICSRAQEKNEGVCCIKRPHLLARTTQPIFTKFGVKALHMGQGRNR